MRVDLERLTERERGVLDHVAEGHSNKEIAHRLGVSARTVQKHLQRIYAKLGVKGRTAAAVFTIHRNGQSNRGSEPL